MMGLKVHSVEGKGDLGKEAVWIDVLEDVADLGFYMICDTTFTGDHSISNELRHMFWFKKMAVKKGDLIKLSTTKGTFNSAANKNGSTTHFFYWNLGRTVWNKDGDAFVLFGLNGWSSHRI